MSRSMWRGCVCEVLRIRKINAARAEKELLYSERSRWPGMKRRSFCLGRDYVTQCFVHVGDQSGPRAEERF